MPLAHLRVAAAVAVLLLLMAGCGRASNAGGPGAGSPGSPGSTGSTGSGNVGSTGSGNTGSTGSGNTGSGEGSSEDSPGEPSGGMPPAPPPGAPAPLPEPPGSVIPTPSVSDPVPGQRLRQVAWQVVVADPASRQVVVQAVVGGLPCDRVTGVETVETASSVTVTVWAGPQTGATGCDGPVPAMAQIVWVRVPLADVLGGRTVVPPA